MSNPKITKQLIFFIFFWIDPNMHSNTVVFFLLPKTHSINSREITTIHENP